MDNETNSPAKQLTAEQEQMQKKIKQSKDFASHLVGYVKTYPPFDGMQDEEKVEMLINTCFLLFNAISEAQKRAGKSIEVINTITGEKQEL